MVRNRYFSGHCLKSAAREGDSAGLEEAGTGSRPEPAGGVLGGADIPGRLSGGTDTVPRPVIGSGAVLIANGDP
ncbi:hypothetical protein GCM10011588_03930 [Nocardia jinanensis]|uniref:Uncharacterized protein n=1 Tax=Nocardia jinanensis TaxID=382504 RepID=A0A917R6N5_9NOCA|nr:hypothetical protein GCM10011588_03930 [Nocardia jinanensis]